MSLHAQLPPEALAKLHTQQRNSTITSIIISILVVLLIGIIMLYLLLPTIDNFTPEIVSYQAGAEDKKKITKREMTRAVQRKPSASSSSMAKVIAANTTSPTAIPVPEIDVPDPSTDFGNGDDFGDGWGNGDGGGGGFGNIPASMKKRCSLEDRLARLQANGGNQQCEEAVMKSLRWLKKNQNADGSWTGSHKAAMTGFAVLAFLGHCETPDSEEFGDAVTRGIVYLINLGMKNDGRLATTPVNSNPWVYEHGIATYALAEAYTFCSSLRINIPNLAEVTKTAGDLIITGQGDSGGWVYKYESTDSGDNSVGFWQIQVLKACKHTKLWEDNNFKTVSLKALEWLRNQKDDGTWNNTNKHSGRLHMSTCLATFMLEVYYRFLPATGAKSR